MKQYDKKMSQLKSNWLLLTNVACPLHNNQQSKEHQQQPHAPLPISKTGLKELLPPMPSSFTRHGSPFQKQDRALTLNTVIRNQQRKHPGETHHRRQNTRTKQATEVFYIREKEKVSFGGLVLVWLVFDVSRSVVRSFRSVVRFGRSRSL